MSTQSITGEHSKCTALSHHTRKMSVEELIFRSMIALYQEEIIRINSKKINFDPDYMPIVLKYFKPKFYAFY